MSDEPQPEEEVPAVEAEAPEGKAGKKAKPAKKKTAEPQEEAQSEAAPAADQEAAPPAEPAAEAAPEPTAMTTEPPPAQLDEVFAQGVQSLLRADYDAADNFFGQALTDSRKRGDQAGQIAALEQLGHLCYLRGAEAQARDYYQQAGLMRAA